MDHIKQHDWCSSGPDVHFLNEEDIDSSVTEKILRNKFHDPLISSDSDDDGQPLIKINWDEIFSKKKLERAHKTVVPGFHAPPPYPKLSALTSQQHYQCLKVLCAKNPHVLPAEFIPRPTKQDHRVFEEIKETYAKEQQEFIEWAKTLWTTSHCVRALRPKPPLEMVYDAEYKVTAHMMLSFPKTYTLAAQIPLETPNSKCDMLAEKELINVNINSLPKITIPDMSERVYIMKPYPVPEPCTKHPCRFLLPNESSMTVLPLSEVHAELAQYAADGGARHVAAEEGLRCLLELDRPWLLALSVCQVISPEGPASVLVLGGECSVSRAAAAERARRAYARLLRHALAPPLDATAKRRRGDSVCNPSKRPSITCEPDSSDEDDTLVIDTDNDNDEDVNKDESEREVATKKAKVDKSEEPTVAPASAPRDDYFSCTCSDTFDKPPHRSYKKWRVVNRTSNDQYNVIVHCPHRVRGQSGEVVLEPIPEYQVDVGGSQLSTHAQRSQALALMLRKNASVLNVRIDSPSGEIVTSETVSLDDLNQQEDGIRGVVCDRVFTALDQLQGVRPGHYLLQHDPGHGANALLYRPAAAAAPGLPAAGLPAAGLPAAGLPAAGLPAAGLAAPGDADEARSLRQPPALAPVLLPIHKHRKILPCAFTPFANMLTRDTKKPVARQKTPPQAIKLGGTPGDGSSRGKVLQRGSRATAPSERRPRCPAFIR